jgi:hypothetical protein
MAGTSQDEMFRPYLPAVVIDWLRDDPQASHRVVDGTLVFVDICGFTRLTERFARAGQVGAKRARKMVTTAG